MRTFSWGGPQQISFFQLHGLSPALKSLHLASIRASVSEIISLTYCFPLLEDLSSHSEAPESHPDGWATYSTLPKLSGSLLLHGDNRSVTRGLLRLPCGLSLEPDVLGSQSEFKMLAGITVIDPRTSGELCIERAPSR